jgi:hypothetical protein
MNIEIVTIGCFTVMMLLSLVGSLYYGCFIWFLAHNMPCMNTDKLCNMIHYRQPHLRPYQRVLISVLLDLLSRRITIEILIRGEHITAFETPETLTLFGIPWLITTACCIVRLFS